VVHLFKNQISSFTIDIMNNYQQTLVLDANTLPLLFTNILSTLINLQYLNFCPSLFFYQRLSFHFSPPIFNSSKLLELHIGLFNFSDCLYLLDGRFNQLRTLYVTTTYIYSSSAIVTDDVNSFDYYLTY
jgi:hypothetical protein